MSKDHFKNHSESTDDVNNRKEVKVLKVNRIIKSKIQ